jgi:hypothetical protein
MADKNFKVKNGLDIGDNISTSVTKTTINSASEVTLDSIPTGTVKSVDYSLTLFQDAGVIGKKYFATENGLGASIQEYGSVSVNRSEYSGVWIWTTRTSNFGNSNIRSVAFGNNLWVAGGYSGSLRTSTDAITWTTRTSNFGQAIRSVAFDNNLWVAGGELGELRTSTDAITWTTQTSNFGNTNIHSVAYGNSLWVAAGDSSQLRTSTDAVTWTTRTSNFGNTSINSVAHGNNLWVAGGANGQLRTENISQRLLALTVIVANGGVAGSEATAILKKETVVA